MIPQPGDIGFHTITGILGWWIRVLQTIAGDGSRYTHIFVVVNDRLVLEAQPRGSRYVPLSRYLGKSPFMRMNINDPVLVAKVAAQLHGVPYSFLDYLALALAHFGIKPRWLRKYIADKGHMICSQLADEFARRCGQQLFDDGRLPQDTTPGDLANVSLERGWLPGIYSKE